MNINKFKNLKSSIKNKTNFIIMVGWLVVLLLGSAIIFLNLDSQLYGLFPYDRIDKFHPNKDKEREIDGEETYDFIVVGSGSSGSVVASRLSEDAHNSVLLLEAGGSDNDWKVKYPRALYNLFRSEKDWNYEGVPQERLNGNIIYCPRGKVLGGSASFNSMIYMRGTAYDYDEWEKYAKGWNWDSALHYFKKSECNLNKDLNDDFHGRSGPWKIDTGEVHGLSHTLLKSITETLGIPVKDELNGEKYQTEGLAFNQFNKINGERFSVSDAFLSNEVLGRPNLFIKLRAHVVKVLFENNKAVGVLVDVNGKIKQIKASREVILSAGSYNTPQILMLSGIGDAEELAKHKIPLVFNNTHVGKHLSDHLTFQLVWEPKDLLKTGHILDSKLENYKSFLDWLLFRKGIGTNAGVDLNGLFQTEISKARGEKAPDIQIIPLNNIHQFTDKFDWTIDSNPRGGYGVQIVLAQPKSEGSVTLRSSDYKDPPVIDHNTFEVKDDEDRMIEAFKTVLKVGDHPLIKEFGNKLVLVDTSSDESLRESLKRMYYYMYHPTSTASLGLVVDERLRVKGVQGLRVIDASVMPKVIRANTNAASVMIGEKGSDMIKEDYRENK